MSNPEIPSFPDFGKLVPGFDFLQNLSKQAAGSSSSPAALPNLGGWVAPTLNVEDLDKRIQELKAVQFWLDQNAAALKATIQALELQKMTLATLKGMNFSMAEVANAFKIKTPDSAPDKPKTFAGFEIPPSAFQAAQASPAPEAEPPAAAQPEAAPAAGVVDPMQWWGALTQQFQTIAADAMKEAAKKSALDTDAVKKATDMAAGLAKGMAESASKTVGGGARAAMDTALRSSQAWPTPVASKTASRASPKAAAKTAAKAPARKAPARKAAAKTTRKSGG